MNSYREKHIERNELKATNDTDVVNQEGSERAEEVVDRDEKIDEEGSKALKDREIGKRQFCKIYRGQATQESIGQPGSSSNSWPYKWVTPCVVLRRNIDVNLPLYTFL